MARQQTVGVLRQPEAQQNLGRSSSCPVAQADPHGHRTIGARRQLSAQAAIQGQTRGRGSTRQAAKPAPPAKGMDDGGPAPAPHELAKAAGRGRGPRPWPAGRRRTDQPNQRRNAAASADRPPIDNGIHRPHFVEMEQTPRHGRGRRPRARQTTNTLSTCCFSVGSIGGPSLIRWRRSRQGFVRRFAPPAASSVRREPRSPHCAPVSQRKRRPSVKSELANGPSTTEMGQAQIEQGRQHQSPCHAGGAIEVGQAHASAHQAGAAASSCSARLSSWSTPAAQQLLNFPARPPLLQLGCGHIKSRQ